MEKVLQQLIQMNFFKVLYVEAQITALSAKLIVDRAIRNPGTSNPVWKTTQTKGDACTETCSKGMPMQREKEHAYCGNWL